MFVIPEVILQLMYFLYFLSYRQVSPYDFEKLDTLMKKVTKEKQPFERLEMKKEDLLEMFKVNRSNYIQYMRSIWKYLINS